MSENRKYIICVGDGMADFPVPELGGKTPLEYAQTPNMDRVASSGVTGMVSTVPDGMQPGSDVANMSLLGYDPSKYYSGRAPIEAASMGITLGSEEVAFRCNLVTLENECMRDYSAGHIDTADAHTLLRVLSDNLGTDSIRFYPGVSYRHLVVITGIKGELQCTPPHDITDRKFGPFLPRGPGSDILLSLMERAHELFAESDYNRARIAEGKRPATDIWLWGQGASVSLPSIPDRWSIQGGVISAVDLVRGLGVLAGLEPVKVSGATGYLGTNYPGKVEAALEILKKKDFVYLHVEAPDETSHEGSLTKKIQAIEEFDRHIVGPILRERDRAGRMRMLVAPDHATPISTKTHHSGPVPYAACGEGIVRLGIDTYSETAALLGRQVIQGPQLFERFLQGML